MHRLGGSQPLYPPGIYDVYGFALGSNLTAFINNGSLPLARVNDAATRMMLPYFALGQDKASFPALPNNITVQTQEAAGHIRAAGAASAVLLKNEGVLPLKKNANLALFGFDARNNPNPNQAGNGFEVRHSHNRLFRCSFDAFCCMQVAPGVFVPIGTSCGNINGTVFTGWGAACSV